MPKILSVLESGCHKGQINPQHVYPNVLPLVSQLVPKIVSSLKSDSETDDKLSKFYSKLLTGVHVGLQYFLSLAPKATGQQLLRKGGSSQNARLAVQTFFDCVLFAVTNYPRPKVSEIIESKVVEWTSDVLIVGGNELESEILFRSLSDFIWSMEKKFGAKKFEEADEKVSEFYWSLLGKISSLAFEVYNAKRLDETSQFLTSLIGNSLKQIEEKKEKKGGLKFVDETEKVLEKRYLTNAFSTIHTNRGKFSGANVPFEKLPPILQKTVVDIASKSVEKVLSEAVDFDSKQHVQFLTNIFDSFSTDGDVSKFYSQLLQKSTSTSDSAVDLLQAVANSNLLNEAAGSGSLVDFCLVIARAISPESKLVLYESLFERSNEKGVTDWLLASLLHAEEDGRTVLSSNAFSGKLCRIADDIPDGHDCVSAGTWSLIAIAFKNPNLISAESLNVILSSLSSAVRKSVDQKFKKLYNFLNDLFLFWSDNPQDASEVVSTEGGQNLIFELFKVSCAKKELLNVDVSSFWNQGFKNLTPESGRNEFVVKASAHVKQLLQDEETSRIDEEIIFQSVALITALRRGGKENGPKVDPEWQQSWLKMVPDVISSNVSLAQDETENFILFSVKESLNCSVLKLRSTSKENKVAVLRKKKYTEFFLKTADRLFKHDQKVHLSPHALDVLALAIGCHSEDFENDSELIGIAKNFVFEKVEGRGQLIEIIFKNSKLFGWEWSLALNRLLTWSGCSVAPLTVSSLTPASFCWSEHELQTIQALAKFSSQEHLRELFTTEVGRLMSLQSNESPSNDLKSKITSSLILLSTSLRHLDLQYQIELKENLKSVLDLVAFWRQTREDDFLYAVNVEEKTFSDVTFVVAVCRFIDACVDVLTDDIRLDGGQWDLVLCSLSSWVQSVDESSSILKKISAPSVSKNDADKVKCVTLLAVATFRLASTVTSALHR